MPPSRAATYLRDPITVPRQERVEHYREQAARYRHMAEREARSFIREGLLELSRQCDARAAELEALREGFIYVTRE